jgi:hypothetical protein
MSPQKSKERLFTPEPHLALFTHLSLDIRGNAEEQGPVEGKFNHVVPILGRDHALGEERVVRDSRATSREGLTSPHPAP